MTRKHFTAIANILREQAAPHMPHDKFVTLVYSIGDALSESNPAFDADRFAMACIDIRAALSRGVALPNTQA